MTDSPVFLFWFK